VFVVRGLELARAGGRLAAGASAVEGVPVLTIDSGVMHVVGDVSNIDQAVEVMAAHVRRSGRRRLRVGVGMADAATAPFCDALEARLSHAAEVGEVVRYRVGPSVGAHTGPGTVGVMY